MNKFLFRSYVAIGDSLTEGLGDIGFFKNRMGKGWADRLAVLLSKEAAGSHEGFYYANLAVRGSSSLEILTAQVEDALRLRPDLVTIMSGANDLMSGSEVKLSIQALLRGAISRMHDAGIHVILLDVAKPNHSRLFRPLAHKADEMSSLIRSIGSEFGAPVIQINDMREFDLLDYWSSDMAHFSHIGHVTIANQVAEHLGLTHRVETPQRRMRHSRSFLEVAIWFFRDVIPFFKRRVLGQSSGDGLDPKQFDFICLASPNQNRADALPASFSSTLLAAQ